MKRYSVTNGRLLLVGLLLLSAGNATVRAQTPGTGTPMVVPQSIAAAASVASSTADSDAASAASAAATQGVRIGPGDLIEVTVFDVPDLSGRFRVSDAGNIDLPVTGRVHVENLDAEAAARAIEDRLRQADIVKSPSVAVFVLEYASQGVTLMGDVKAPGVYPILGNRRLLDVLASGGGLAITSGKDIRIQHRNDFDHPEIVTIDNITVTPTSNPLVQPGDTITVPRSGIVYVVGDVGHPGGFLVENNNRLDLLKLLALAGGPNRTAGLNKTRLIRTTSTGRVEIDIALKKVMEGKSQSLMLRDSDILYVPSSEAKYLTYRGIEAAIQVGTGFVVYRNY